MKSKFDQLLNNLARQFVEDNLEDYPELAYVRIQSRQLWELFRQAHGDNLALMNEVAALLDAESLLRETEADLSLRLGLQIGRELGR